ncbi:hypothetical protein BU24DRAFT_352607, partial [Aaosphaeria arxii CBS 175.79]
DRELVSDVWKTTICSEITQTISIITPAITFLTPFLVDLECGYSGWTSQYIKL